MKIAEFAVKNRQFTIVAILGLLAMGISSVRSIPRAEDPAFPAPWYTVIAVYPGASPTDLEQLVADPIEKKLRALDDIKAVRTNISDGVAAIVVESYYSIDVDKKYDEVVREVNALKPSLPTDLARLEVTRWNASDVNIVQVALVSESAPYSELDKRARALRDEFEKVPGVKKAEVWGYPRQEVQVAIDLGRLSELRLPLAQVLGAIGGESANIPGGGVDAGERRYNVKTSGSYRSVGEVRETIIGTAQGSVVRVGDVAEVRWGYQEQAVRARYNGKRAVWVTANMKDRASIMTVRDGLWERLDAFEKSLPKSIVVGRGFDQSRNVQKRLSRLSEDFVIAIALVLLTLLPLGFRASAIVMVSIPLSLAIGVTVLDATGFTINQLSIVGFVIALGLLVDDAIVVVENISRFMREGYTRVEAAIAATQQIFVAVVGTTATLIFAFIPLLMLPEGAGKFVRGLPAAVIYTILASLVISLTVVPFLASMFLKSHADPRGNIALRWMNRAIEATYSKGLHLALAYPARTIGAAAALFLGSLALVPVIGFSLFPKAGTPQVLVTVESPDGASVAATDSAVRFVERVLLNRPDVQHVYANIGRGNPLIYYNVFEHNEDAAYGDLFVLFEKIDKHSPLKIDSLQAVFDAYPAAHIRIKEFWNGTGIDAPIAMRLAGKDLDTLRALAGQVETLIASTPGTRSVKNALRLSRTDLKLDVDRTRAGLLGIPTVEVDRTVRMGVAGLTAGRLRDIDGQEYDINVQLPRGERQTISALKKTYVSSVSGALVPLAQVASLRFESSPPLINHFDGNRVARITADVVSGYNTDRVTKEVLRKMDALKMPEGYSYTPEGEIESRQESFGGLGTAILIAIFGILAILVLEFKTFRGMLIVASVIPLGMIGGLTALLVSGYTLSFMSTIGFVALVGIEIKNSILLVDFTNQLREGGMALDEAIEQAGRIRFLPIVLTTMTAIGGLLPLAVQGSGMYSPLATVIIGGLISSTVLARLVTPVMYKLLPPAMEPAAAASRLVPAVASLQPAG